jgi:hypothetical protein
MAVARMIAPSSYLDRAYLHLVADTARDTSSWCAPLIRSLARSRHPPHAGTAPTWRGACGRSTAATAHLYKLLLQSLPLLPELHACLLLRTLLPAHALRMLCDLLALAFCGRAGLGCGLRGSCVAASFLLHHHASSDLSLVRQLRLCCEPGGPVGPVFFYYVCIPV